MVANASKPGANRAELLPSLAGALINALIGLQDAVLERYALHQMYGGSLVEKAKAELMRREALAAKGAYQTALTVFEKCFAADEANQKVQADWLEKLYRPRINAIKAQAKSMDAVGLMIAAFRKELIAVGEDPNDSPDVSTLGFAYAFLKKAQSPAQEKRRLPRVVNLLTRGWEKLLQKRKVRVDVDHLNIIGLARTHWGLKQYGEAMKFFRIYTDGVPPNSKVYWPAQRERCECHLEGYQNSAQAMKNLMIHIKMLQMKDPKMGGFAPEFQVILRKAQEYLKKAQSAKGGAEPGE